MGLLIPISLIALCCADAIPPLKKGAMTPQTIPLFTRKVELILQQLLKYSHMYPLREDLEAIAVNALTSDDGNVTLYNCSNQ
jgi:hypothetical protein